MSVSPSIHVLWPDACGSRAILKAEGTRYDYPDHSLTVFSVVARRGRFTAQPIVAVSVPNGPWSELSPTLLPAWSYSFDEVPTADFVPRDDGGSYGRGTLAHIDIETYRASEAAWDEFARQCIVLSERALSGKVMGTDLARALSSGDDLLLFEFYHREISTLASVLAKLSIPSVESLERLARVLYGMAESHDAWNPRANLRLTPDECHQVCELVWSTLM